MRRVTLGLLAIAGLLLVMMAAPQVEGALLDGEKVDRSMITTNSGDDEFYLDKGDTKFLWDLIVDEKRDMDIRINVVNPSSRSRQISLSLKNETAENWHVKISRIEDPDGEDITEDSEVIEGRSYRIENVESGEQLSVILNVHYEGEDSDDQLEVTLISDIDNGVFSSSKTLTFKTYEGNNVIIWASLVAALIGLGYAGFTASNLFKKEVGLEKLKELSGHIREGADAFLKAEYRVIIIFVAAVTLFLIIGSFLLGFDWKLIPAFLLGALFSASAGNIGMRVATMANAKTAWACKSKMTKGLKIAFSSGAVMGLTVVGLGLLGVTLLYSIWGDVNMLFGFGFGASSIALFARVGGGIYTKAADVGADLVGKVEAGIPEDDPRNPATIADNVGDNVGDVAGMGADLFESYVDSIIAAMALGIVGISIVGNDPINGGSAGFAVVLPVILAGWGIISAVIGTLLVGGREGSDPHNALNRGIYGSSVIMGIGALVIIWAFFGDFSNVWPLFVAMLAGLGAGLIIGKATEYYTSDKKKPTQNVAKSATKGAATDIIAGLGLGMVSTVIPVLAVVATIVVAFLLAGLYGIALAAVGMLSTLGITLATDTYGPVADNAAGLAEMADMGEKVRKRAEDLDAVGNTTAAIGKGFAIGSAGLTALALFTTYIQTANLDLSQFTLVNPYIVSGLFIGGLLPFVFSAMTMKAVGDAAGDMVEEVRRQFKEKKGILTGKTKPDYQRCVEISTKGALKRMVVPSLIAVVVPIIIGSISMEALGGLLAGSIVTGFVLAVMMANSGGAWDNAKKYVESGNLGGKGSDTHKATIVGDTVGDPFKDTSGPSLNILIKLMSIVSLVFVPLFIIINGLF
mgnify:CR=1 FL=1